MKNIVLLIVLSAYFLKPAQGFDLRDPALIPKPAPAASPSIPVDPTLLEMLSKMAEEAHKAALGHTEGGQSLQEEYQQLLVTIDDVPRRAPSFSEPIYLCIGGERGTRGSDEPLTAGETLKAMCDQMRALRADLTPHGDK